MGYRDADRERGSNKRRKQAAKEVRKKENERENE